MCSNVDQVVIVCAPQPRLNPFLIDRYLSAAAHMRTIPATAYRDTRYDHSTTTTAADDDGADGGVDDDDGTTLMARTRSGRKRKGHEMQSPSSIGSHRQRKLAARREAAALTNPDTHGIVAPLETAIICCNKIDLLEQLDVCHSILFFDQLIIIIIAIVIAVRSVTTRIHVCGKLYSDMIVMILKPH
jgi:hypothetical protein